MTWLFILQRFSGWNDTEVVRSITLGFDLGRLSRTVDLAFGGSKVEQDGFDFDSLAAIKKDAKVLAMIYDDLKKPEIDVREPNTSPDLVFCEKSLSGYCVNKNGLKDANVDLEIEAKNVIFLSSHMCIQHCKMKNFNVSKTKDSLRHKTT